MTSATQTELAHPFFPVRQATREGHWLPLYLEPLPGSGERICVGVIASDGSSTEMVEVPELHRLQAVYGPATSAVTFAARLTMMEAASLAKSEGLEGLKALQSRIEGLYIGEEIRRGAGRNLTDLAAIALQQASSFASLKSTRATASEVPSRGRASPLIAAVKNLVVSVRPPMRAQFQRTYKFAEHTRPTVYGFVGRTMIANFATLGGTRGTLTTRVDNAKARLWDLKHLRDGVLRDALAEPMAGREFELLVCPPVHKSPKPKVREAASSGEVAEAGELLEREADRFDLRCRRLASVADVANQLLHREAA